MDKKVILELIRKVKRLTESNVPGESDAAKIKFKKLCEKYGLSEKDFESVEEVCNRYFIYRHEFDRLLLSNLLCMFLKVPGFNCGEYNNVIRIKLTDSQFKNVTESYYHYQRIFDENSKYLMQAIISRNAIGYVPESDNSSSPPPAEEAVATESSQKTSEFDMIRLIKMAVAIEPSPWNPVKKENDKNLPPPVSSSNMDEKSNAPTGNNIDGVKSPFWTSRKSP